MLALLLVTPKTLHIISPSRNLSCHIPSSNLAEVPSPSLSTLLSLERVYKLPFVQNFPLRILPKFIFLLQIAALLSLSLSLSLSLHSFSRFLYISRRKALARGVRRRLFVRRAGYLATLSEGPRMCNWHVCRPFPATSFASRGHPPLFSVVDLANGFWNPVFFFFFFFSSCG